MHSQLFENVICFVFISFFHFRDWDIHYDVQHEMQILVLFILFDCNFHAIFRMNPFIIATVKLVYKSKWLAQPIRGKTN